MTLSGNSLKLNAIKTLPVLITLLCDLNLCLAKTDDIHYRTRTSDKSDRIAHFKIDEVGKSNREMSADDAKSFEKPEFCHGLGCPEFKVIHTTSQYEERVYTQSNWISTAMQGIDLDDASSKMFMRLFRYIQGNNVKKEKIAMTAPVITRIIPGQGPACENNFTMSFFMDPIVNDPPKPSDKDVFLNSLPEQGVFVRHFGGFAKKSEWLENALALGEALDKDGKKFKKDHFFSAGYDSPFKLFNRHNEIWFLKD